MSLFNRRVIAGEDKPRKERIGSSKPAFHKYTEHVSSEPAYISQFGYDNSAEIIFSFPNGLDVSSNIE